MLVSVVLPVRNQAGHIEQVVAAHELALRAVNHELILVVNGSMDESVAACRRAAVAAIGSSVTVLESGPGWGAAVQAGLRAARGGILCYANSARTAPQDLCLAVSLASGDITGAALVKATRRYRKSRLRRAGSLLFNLEARTLFGLATWDVNGTPKAFARTLYERLAVVECGDLIDLELMVKCRTAGATVVGFDTDRTDRIGGRSSTTLVSAVRMYVSCVRLWLDLRDGRRAESRLDQAGIRGTSGSGPCEF